MAKFQVLLILFPLFQMRVSYLIHVIKPSRISLQRPIIISTRFSTASNNENNEVLVKAQRHEIRKKEINNQLLKFNIPVDQFESAVQSSIEGSYNSNFQFGSSAIKTYKSYLQSDHQEANIKISALRTARQIEFLIKKHKSRSAEWVRHNDKQQQQTAAQNNPRRFPISLVLDNVRSAYNVGSIFRSADACNVSEIITTGITPHPGGNGWEKLRKSSLGAELVVPTRHFDTTREVVDMFRKDGTISSSNNCMLVGMETTNLSKNYLDVTYQQDGEGTVIFLGNEVTGVDTELMPLLDVIVEIPMFGNKNSLNIAACTPVILYEVLRQWGVMNK